MNTMMIIFVLMAYFNWTLQGQSSYKSRDCCQISEFELSKYQHIRDISHQFLIVIGVQKSGTTLLHNLIVKHPKIKGASKNGFQGGDKKEVRFFDQEKINFQDYLDIFNITRLQDGYVLTEATPGYFAMTKAACRIKAYLPNARLVLILKNPADRALSHYKMRYFKKECQAYNNCDMQNVPGFYRTMKEKIAQFKSKNCNFFNQSWSSCMGCKPTRDYVIRGLYGPQLMQWLQYFSPAQFLIIPHKETQNVQAMADRIWSFAGLEPFELKLESVHGYVGRDYKADKEVNVTMVVLEDFYARYNQNFADIMATYFQVENFTFS
eukprot:TRINITY_DN10321_c0_g2_i4.p2 TRINITY_DN10321_c0_g2~~TRINITY_DN10321_c0_g2_i4.p2  ORF type:complete len:322 (-),score=20.90 TRINITY_DN10321_c0_g2_i4:409-1374(-)